MTRGSTAAAGRILTRRWMMIDALVLQYAILELFAWPVTTAAVDDDYTRLCHVTSVKFRAANVLEIRWTNHYSSTAAAAVGRRDDVSSRNVTSATSQCLLRLYVDDSTSGGDRATSGEVEERCRRTEQRPVVERFVTASDGRLVLWNATQPGVRYVICLRHPDTAGGGGGATSVDDEPPWSARTSQVLLHQPAAIEGPCTVLIRGRPATRLTGDGLAAGDYIYQQNDRVVLMCNVTGSPAPSFQWYRNSQICANSSASAVSAQTAMLSIDQANKSDSGTYVLRAENKHGRLESEGFVLKMAELSPLAKHRIGNEANEGQSLPLMCRAASGNNVPPPQIAWYTVTELADPHPKLVRVTNRIALGHDGSLIFISLELADRGMYMCEATNDVLDRAEIGSHYTVDVTTTGAASHRNMMPEVINNYALRKTVSGLKGTVVQLQCLFTGRPLPSIVWYHNGQQLPTKDSRYRWSPGNHTLTIGEPSTEDEGLFECIASNSVGSRQYSMNLNIYDPPHIVESPKPVNVSIGGMATFQCDADGIPPPSVRWFLNGKDISHLLYGRSSTSGSASTSISKSQLTLFNVTVNDMGNIRCNMSNDHGYVVAATYLNVFSPTRITESPSSVNVSMPRRTSSEVDTGDDATLQQVSLSCGAVTDLQTALRITWQVIDSNNDKVSTVSNLTSASDYLWRTTENRSLVISITDDAIKAGVSWQQTANSPRCLLATCTASNGLTVDSRTAMVCQLEVMNFEMTHLEWSQTTDVKKWPIYVGIAAVVVLIILVIALIAVCQRRRCDQNKQRHCRHNSDSSSVSWPVQRRTLTTQFSVDSRTAILEGNPSSGSSSSSSGRIPVADSDCLVCENGWCTSGPLFLNDSLQLAIKDMAIPRERLSLGPAIGKGQFGRVFSAELRSSRGSLTQHVAVKTMKFRPDEHEMVELFLKEALIMKEFHHPNVLHIIGISFEPDGSPMVILPFMANGDLRQFILNPEMEITILELLKLGVQVARGMDYLSKMRFVHRDLAARNCMVNERAVVKVADFGLSRELMRRDYYRSDCSGSVPVPIRWLAPESLEANIFTTMSDVWSYGVLLWELMTRGAVPYSEVDNWQIASHVQHGNRLAQPPFCPDIIFGMIEKCWSNDPSTRPSFEQLVHWLDEVIASAKPGSRISSVLYQNITRGDDTAAASSASANSASASPSIIGGNFDAAGAQAIRGVCD